jgi:hypothetical protein
MATWLALAAFLALIGLPLYLMWGMPRIFRGHHNDDAGGPTVGGGPVGYDNAPSGSTDSGGGDGGGGDS